MQKILVSFLYLKRKFGKVSTKMTTENNTFMQSGQWCLLGQEKVQIPAPLNHL